MGFRFGRWTKIVAVVAGAAMLLGATHVLRAQSQQGVAGEAVALPAQVEFNRDIRPILSDKCYKCHGPGKQEADLRLDKEKSAKSELYTGGTRDHPGRPAGQ